MSEKKLVIEKLSLAYEGLFDVREFYKVIDNWFKDNAYEKREKLSSEIVKESGKEIELILEPWKTISDYVKFLVRVHVIMHDVKEVEITKSGHKTKINKGKVEVYIDSFVETDYAGRWEQKAIFFFLKVFVDKYIYQIYSEKYEAQLKKDMQNFYNTIKAFLNLYKYSS